MNRFLEWVAVLIACLGLAIVASGCAHSPSQGSCVSKCGTLFEGVPNGAMSCKVLQEAEDRTLDAYDRLKTEDFRFEKKYACGQLFGWQIKTSPAFIGHDKDINGGAPYRGASICGSKEMRLQRADNWVQGSYVHEFAHVVQDCEPPKSWGADRPEWAGPGHEGWEKHGVYHLIDLLRKGDL